MSKILKYRIPFAGVAEFDMPKPGEVVHVGWQGHDPEALFVWCEVDEMRPPIRRQFVIVATGEEGPQGWSYAGTAQARDQSYVWHVFQQAVPR